MASAMVQAGKGEPFAPTKHLMQFKDCTATTDFIQRAYEDLYWEFGRHYPEKARTPNTVLIGYTLTEEGVELIRKTEKEKFLSKGQNQGRGGKS